MAINNFTSYGQAGHSGYQKYGLNYLSVLRKVILFPSGLEIATKEEVMAQATWIELTKNPLTSRVYPFPLATDCKPAGGTTIMAKTGLSGDLALREEVSTIVFSYNVNPQLAAQLRKFNFKKWDVAFADAFDNIIGWTPDGTKFRGFTTTSVFFGQMAYSDGAKDRASELTIVLDNPKQWNDSPALIYGNSLDWFPSQLDGCTAVKVAVSAATTAGFTATVTAAGMDATDPNAGYVGLAKTDFVLTKGGSSQALTSATMVDNNDGTYTFTMTNTSGSFTLGLVAAADNSVTSYNIECPTPGAFSIS